MSHQQHFVDILIFDNVHSSASATANRSTEMHKDIFQYEACEGSTEVLKNPVLPFGSKPIGSEGTGWKM
jgi:hypothetical protein